jgi:CRISPR-associated protein Csb1
LLSSSEGDATLNFAALRSLSVGKDRDPLALRRYILGLSLVAFTAPQETFLREGCQLVPDPEREEWSVVRHDGRRESWRLAPGEAATYAKRAAEEFGVGQAKEAEFDAKGAQEALGQTKEERKKSRRSKAKADEGRSES